MSTATEKKPKTFVCDFRPAGHLKRQQIFFLAFDEKHAVESARRQLDKKYGAGRYETSEPVEIADKDLPESESLFASLARQRQQLCPTAKPAAVGNVWNLWATREGQRTPHQLWVVAATESEARAKATARLVDATTGEDDDSPDPMTLLPQCKQLTAETAQATIGLNTSVFSVLTKADAAELIDALREERRQQLITFLEKQLADMREATDKLPVIAKPPRESRLWREAEVYAGNGGDVSAGIKSEPIGV